jgi:hypothetical protein
MGGNVCPADANGRTQGGLEDLSSFNRVFQDREGVSPQRWRQQQLEY